jgi:hypothetical protein
MKRKNAGLVLLAALLAAVMVLTVPEAVLAVTPGLYEVEGNPNCENLYQATVISGPDSDLLDLGSLFGFKYDANPTGDVSSTLTDNGPWVVTNGPQDSVNSVSIFNVVVSEGEGVQFDWSATLGIDAVIVKAQDSNAYVYSPEAFGDTGLVALEGRAVSHVEFCYDYELIAEKTADATWYKTIDWTLTKDVTPASADRFVGQSAQFDYTVTLTKNEIFGPYIVDGTITINNPTPFTVNFDVSDSVDGTAALVDCPSYSLAPGTSVVCDYEANLASNTDGTNTATITSNNVNVKGATATDDYAFGEPLLTEGSEPETISVNDTLAGALGSFSGSDVVNYSLTQDCSAEPGDYSGDGIWTKDYPNTASINETTGDSDSEEVTLTCYAPVLTKDASASYDERHIWDIDKTVDPESQSGFPGSVLPWTWYVEVNETFVEEKFEVTGKINVANPAGSPGDMTVSLVDQLNDGTFATVDCGSGATSVTVATGATATCGYTAIPGGRTATENKATGTFNDIDFVATYPVSFAKNVVKGTANAIDTEIGLDESLTAGNGPWDYDKSYSHTCSSNRADYFVGGVYTQMTDTIVNWAYVYSEGEEQDKDDATTTWTCDASFVDLYKTTNGQPADPTKDIAFALYSGTSELEVVSTMNSGADLQFQTALVPGDEYTICEYPVPAGYTFEISVNGGNVLTYAGPPGTENPTGEVQCFDFNAESAGTTLTFDVENRYPGGAPRTPGYWKNWSTCSGGNQAATAAKLGGVEEGVFLLDDLLPQTLGIEGEHTFTIDECEVGVLVLSAKSVDKEKNMANDAAYTLARALLAARLNQDAGACVPTGTWDGMTFEQVLTAADELLSGVGFDGTGSYLGPKNKKDKDLAAYALWLYEIIDDYNNSELCTGDPSH